MNKEQNQQQKPKKQTADYLKIANRALIVLIFGFGVTYLVGMNDLSIKHFVVQDDKRQVKELKTANTELESQIMALSSYTTINKKVASLKMIKVDQVNYITANTVVARR